MRLHQENFNEVADEFYLYLWEEERPKGLTALQVLERSFPISKVGDVDAEKIVSLNDAVTTINGVLVKAVAWNSQFGRRTTMFGLIPRPKGGFISYKAQCNYRPYKTETYRRYQSWQPFARGGPHSFFYCAAFGVNRSDCGTATGALRS